jgi:hypothetical protein
MVQGMRDHIILAFRAVAISRLQIAEAEKYFVHGFFEEVLHCEDDRSPGSAPGSLSRRPGWQEVSDGGCYGATARDARHKNDPE